ncbi:MAG: RNA polymerase sigma factor [Polyangiales bacterium]
MSTGAEVHRSADGNVVLDDELLRRLEPMLFRYARCRVRSDEIAQDLVQEMWISGLRSFSRFSGRSSVQTWFVAILRRRIADHYRRRGPDLSYGFTAELEDASSNPLLRIIERQQLERVHRSMRELAPRERQAIELCAVQETDRIDAARSMGLSRAALRVTLCLGRRRLRVLLEAPE